MYSNRTSTYLNVTQENNGDVITFPVFVKPLESLQISLVHFQMNNLISNITPTNNQLDITIQSAMYSFIIPTKFYTIIELRDYLNDILKIHSIIVTYKDYKIKFISTHSITIMSTSTCKRVLGLSKNDQTSGLIPAFTLICPYSIDMTIHNVSIKIKEFNIEWFQLNTITDGTFIKIPVNCLYGQVLYYNPAVPRVSILKKHKIRSVTITMSDDYGNTIEDGFDATFKFDYVYLPDDKKIEHVLVSDKETVFPKGFQRYDGKTNELPESGSFIL